MSQKVANKLISHAGNMKYDSQRLVGANLAQPNLRVGHVFPTVPLTMDWATICRFLIVHVLGMILPRPDCIWFYCFGHLCPIMKYAVADARLFDLSLVQRGSLLTSGCDSLRNTTNCAVRYFLFLVGIFERI